MTNVLRVYQQTKRDYGDNVLALYRIGKVYRAYFKDAGIISGVLETKLIVKFFRHGRMVVPTTQFDEKLLQEMRNRLLDFGSGVCVSMMRDSRGRFALK